MGDVLFHREALARALHTYEDIALIGSVADVHAARILAEEKRPDVLIVDSPSGAVTRALAAHPLACKIVVIGAVGGPQRQLERRGGAIFIGSSASLDEVHVALRSVKPRHVAPKRPTEVSQELDDYRESILTPREQQVSRLIAGGCSNKEIAETCGIGLSTVKNHVHRILGKCNFQRRTQIARLAGGFPSYVRREPAPLTDEPRREDDAKRFR